MSKRLGMLIDLDRCIGCWACAVACKMENQVPEGMWWQSVPTVGGAQTDTSAGEFPGVTKHYEPKNCFHCAEPPCLPVCPTDAISQRDDGIVSIDYDACIGCHYCMVACPYDAFEFNEEPPRFAEGLEPGHGAAEVETRPQGVVEKCTFCVHRVDRDLDPACVSVCPTDAILFGDLADPDSRVAREARRPDAYRVGEELGAEPSVYYRPLRHGRNQRRSCPPSSG